MTKSASFLMRVAQRLNVSIFTTVLLVSLSASSPFARAAFHLWQVKEVFSNADGSVQFIELFNDFDFEEFVGFRGLESNSDGVIKSITFPNDLTTPPATAGRHILIATPGFASLPGGVTPDFTLPDPVVNGPFFNPNAAQVSIIFTGSGADMGFSGTSPPADGYFALPKDGVSSITNTNLYNDPILVVGTNSPTNFHNESGSVNLAVPEPAGGLLTIAVWGLFGLRLRVTNRGDFARRLSRRKSRSIDHVSNEYSVPPDGPDCMHLTDWTNSTC